MTSVMDQKRTRIVAWWRFAVFAGACLAVWAQPASGQIVPPRSAPHDGYWQCFGPFLDGDFRTAAKSFREAARDGIMNLSVTTPGPWIDAICYHAMIGESYYQMGNLADALDEYSAALRFYLAHRDWMLRIDMPQGIEPETNIKANVTWGTTSRKTILGHYQPRYSSFTGRINNQQVVTGGGVVAPPTYYPVYASEIVRCTALALSRRRTIMGPVSEHDALTTQVVEAAARVGGNNHWSVCWSQLELGLALAAANRMPQAITELQKSLLAAGQYDHPLTCLGLLELGRIAFEQGKYEAAITYFHEATISGAYFERYDILEEAFRLAAEAHLLAGHKGAYPPLPLAIASLSKVRMLNVSLLTSLAEQMIANRELPAATTALTQARGATGRHEMSSGAIGARLNFATARAALSGGDSKSGATALATALTYQKVASPRLFQIGLADVAFRSGNLTERIADLVYTDALREPNRVDWTTATLDTIALLTSPHPLPYEHWFELALARKENEKALNIAERIRRHRFLVNQALGGRLLALRWVLEGPAEGLTPEATLQRQDLLVKFPRYAELSKRSAELRASLQQLPIAPTDENQIKQQQDQLAELGKVSAQQEAQLQLMALERVPSEIAFPPLRETKEIQERLSDGTIVFYYFVTSRNMYAFAIAQDRYAAFTVQQTGKIKQDVVEVLKGMGHHDRNQPVAIEDLKANGWKPAAQRLLAQLTNDAKAEEWTKYRELVIVPDGVLWYLPFEALPAPGMSRGDTASWSRGDTANERGTMPLLMQLPVRYAPTLGLAVSDGRREKPIPRTAIVAGKLLPRGDEAAFKAQIELLATAAGDCAVLRKEPGMPSSIFAATVDRLVVLAENDDAEKGPLAWSPFVLDAGKAGSSVSDWTLLPLAGVDQILLPGFHTAAETSLKRGSGTGEEVFNAICGLMASGCRTIMLSRWRVGGQSTFDLVREFLQELPHGSATSAWRRSVQLAADRYLDPTIEGRLKAPPASEGVKGDHPFFWAGYMLIDTGVRREEDNERAAK
jgi:tetratricopeptide (TPR) repeat protein